MRLKKKKSQTLSFQDRVLTSKHHFFFGERNISQKIEYNTYYKHIC